MTRQYQMQDVTSVAARASQEIERWLRAHRDTISIQNVEDDPTFQKADIDLLWHTKRGLLHIEVKADRWDKTGNFFFETSSNKEKATPGCFLYSEADLLFYYFVETGVLYMLPLPATRQWFLENIEQFQERETTTPVGDSFYTTVGRLVPIQTLVRQVRGVVRILAAAHQKALPRKTSKTRDR